MTCEDARRSIPFIQYAEISFDEEELVHAHLAECAECRAEFELGKALNSALDERELDLSPFLLRRSRDQLAAALETQRANSARHSSWLAGIRSAFGATTWMPSFAKPAGAVALLALGFFGARLTPFASIGMQAGLLDPSNSRVRYVEPGPQGRVQLVVDETRQRVISGRIDDSQIRALLLSAAKDPSDPGLRVESVDILKNRTESDDVRTALVYALGNDANAGVRLKALEGLKPYASQPDVRKALSQVLLTDNNPGLRTQAIDLLTQNSNEEHVVGVLQELMRRHEDNGYVRLRCEKALRGMKASVDTY
jgi:hypothetical protein